MTINVNVLSELRQANKALALLDNIHLTQVSITARAAG